MSVLELKENNKYRFFRKKWCTHIFIEALQVLLETVVNQAHRWALVCTHATGLYTAYTNPFVRQIVSSWKLPVSCGPLSFLTS